jgi:hypothetical protein
MNILKLFLSEKQYDRTMDRFLSLTLRKLILLVIFWVVLYIVYINNEIRCEPCPEGMACPPCVSEIQVAVVVIFILSIVYFLSGLIFTLTKKKRK